MTLNNFHDTYCETIFFFIKTSKYLVMIKTYSVIHAISNQKYLNMQLGYFDATVTLVYSEHEQ